MNKLTPEEVGELEWSEVTPDPGPIGSLHVVDMQAIDDNGQVWQAVARYEDDDPGAFTVDAASVHEVTGDDIKHMDY